MTRSISFSSENENSVFFILKWTIQPDAKGDLDDLTIATNSDETNVDYLVTLRISVE